MATAAPPQNIEVEESVLGAMLVAEPALTRVIDEVKLNAEDFYLEKHATIFACVHDLYAASKPVDELSVAEALSQRNQIEEAGGKHYVSELAAKVPAAGNAKHYAEIVRQNALLRRLLGAGQQIQSWVHERDGELPQELLRRGQALLGEIGDKAGDQDGATPAGALAASRVDLTQLIREGIPDRRYVPGGEGWLMAGKRYLMPAPAGTGKSLATVIIAADIVEAGGTVAILDVENGSDEYARRLEDVLAARDSDEGKLAEGCVERLRYFQWPRLSASWGGEQWAAALAGVDLVVFDSSRLMLSAAGLEEDSNDDYAAFVNALLVPLARAGITTLILDNTGHEERERARGASAKADLNEVIYVVKLGAAFDHEQTGQLRLVLSRTRFAGLPGELHVPVGGGVYGPVVEAEAAADSAGFRPTTLMERLSEAIEVTPGIGKRELRSLVRGKHDAKDVALHLLEAEGYMSVQHEGRAQRHYLERPYRASEDPRVTGDEAAGGVVNG